MLRYRMLAELPEFGIEFTRDLLSAIVSNYIRSKPKYCGQQAIARGRRGITCITK